MNTPATIIPEQRKVARIKALQANDKGAPTTRAREKLENTLAWLGVFGTITTPMVKELLNIQSDGYLPKLQKDGLVQCTAIGKMNGKVWTLTPKGREAAELILGWDASRVRSDKLNVSIATHNELAQLAALQLLGEAHAGNIRTLTIERDLRQKGIAAPDVVMDCQDVETDAPGWFAIEIETNQKGDRELRDKMVRLIELMVQQQRCDKLHVAFYLNGDKPKARYRRVWEEALNKVKGHVRNNEYPAGTAERMQKLTYPTCSTHDLPKWSTESEE